MSFRYSTKRGVCSHCHLIRTSKYSNKHTPRRNRFLIIVYWFIQISLFGSQVYIHTLVYNQSLLSTYKNKVSKQKSISLLNTLEYSSVILICATHTSCLAKYVKLHGFSQLSTFLSLCPVTSNNLVISGNFTIVSMFLISY